MNKPKPKAVEDLLNQINYSSSLINHINDTVVDTNINRCDDSGIVREKPKVLVIPEIVISESRDDGEGSFNVPLVVPRERNSGVSDSNNENVPQVTENVSAQDRSGQEDVDSEEQVPPLSQLLGKRLF